MEKKTYLEKLKDPRWQKKRLEILDRDHWQCKACADKEKTLNVHHIFYLPNTEPWEIPSGLLITLCENCHKGGPCEPHKSCDDCPEYKNDCDGPSDIPKEIIYAISALLNEIWKNDKNGDYYSAIVFAMVNFKGETKK